MSGPGRPCAWVRFAKRGPARFVGHLDLARAIDRAVRRAELPVAYTEGFNPRAKIAFAAPLPLGVEGEAELCVIDLAGPASADEIRALNEQLPEGLCVLDAEIRSRGRRSPVADIARAGYCAELALDGVDQDAVSEAVARLVEAEDIAVLRRTKRSEKTANIRPGIQELGFTAGEPPRLDMLLGVGNGPVAKPEEVLSALNAAIGREGAVEFERLVRVSLA